MSLLRKGDLLKVLLISPPHDRLREMEDNFFPPGLGYIAAVLRDKGHYVRIYNADMGPETSKFRLITAKNRLKLFKTFLENLNNPDFYVWREIEKVVKDFSPDVVGITMLSDVYASALKTADICKKVNKNVLIVAGGPHVTIMPEKVIKEPSIDFTISGEGEFAFAKLLDMISKGINDFSSLTGLSYKKGDNVFVSRSPAVIENINVLPLPARDLVLFPDIYKPNAMNFILASRGCPYRCTYCASAKIWGNRYKFRSVESIISEIEVMIDKYKVVHFRFWDDTFTSIKQNILELCNELIKKGLNKRVHWNCLTRVNVIDEELLTILKKSGCTMMAIGVESGSERILKLTKKGITLDQIRKAVKLIKKHKFLLHCYWMLGLPQETEEDIRASIKLMKELDADGNMVNVLRPYPGTELYGEIVKLGLLEADYDWKDPINFYHGWTSMTQERFDALLNEMLETAEKVSESKVKVLKKAWLYKKSLLQNPKRIIKEIKKRISKVS